MADDFEDLFVASYGGFEFHALDVDDDLSRVVTLHKAVNKSGATVRDGGAAPRRSSLQIVFVASALTPSPIEDSKAFLILLGDGKAHTLIHPIDGAYSAKPEGIRRSVRAGVRDRVDLYVDFVEDGDPAPPVIDLRPGVPRAAGLAQVSIAAADTESALVEAELESEVPAQTLATAEAWNADAGELTRRDIEVALGRATDAIDGAIRDLRLLEDVERQPVLVAFQRLGYSMRRAADVAISETPSLTTHRVAADIGLLALAARLYGGAQALEQAERLERLNTIRNPALIPAGTILTIVRP